MTIKKFFTFTLLYFFAATAAAQVTFPLSSQREVRAVWLTTIGGLDWPKGYARTAEGIAQQKEQLCRQLDRLQAMGMNTVLFQTRVRGTVVYPSDIEPWDGCLSGRPGVSPGYDALAFAIEECHKRGMMLQAWVVAFPIMSFTVAKQLGRQALPARRPELCRKAGDHWMMDPGVPATADYVASICEEIVRKYDVDGIHLDYVRYPEHSIPFDDNATFRRYGKGMKRAEWRRANVTRCVQKIHSAIKALKPWVVLSCSPVGKHDDLPRYSSFGWNARTAVAQDVQAWLKLGIMDEIFPMMYFTGNHFYPFALDWVCDCNGRIVAPGLGVYMLNPKEKDWDLETITRELGFLRNIRAGGQAYFRSAFLLANDKGIADYLSNHYYRAPALVPALTWEDAVAPDAPQNITVDKGAVEWRVAWDAAHDPTPGDRVRYNVYCSTTYPVLPAGGARLEATYLDATSVTLVAPAVLGGNVYYAVTAIDRFGNESAPAEVNKPETLATIKVGMKIDGGKVRLPARGGEQAVLFDAAGRQISVTPYDTLLDVSVLSPGFYMVYAQERRGEPHRIGEFVVKP